MLNYICNKNGGVNVDYEDETKNMSIKELHGECMTFFFITSRKDKPVLLTAEEKDHAESLFRKSIKRMENCTDSIELLLSCAFALQNLIKESHDKEDNIPAWIRDWKPK